MRVNGRKISDSEGRRGGYMKVLEIGPSPKKDAVHLMEYGGDPLQSDDRVMDFCVVPNRVASQNK